MNELLKNNQALFDKYYQLLIEENAKYNLTAITDRLEVDIKHFEDSLALGQFYDLNNKSLCDVGSGAGFPGIPLKIAYPSLKLTIIESNLKKCQFLEMVVKELGLNDVTVIWGRVELQAQLTEQFDIVCARAVTDLSILVELASAIAKREGMIVAYKGLNYEAELANSHYALKKLNLKLMRIDHYELRENLGSRVLLGFEKPDRTPVGFPRAFARIKSKPL